MIPKDIIKSGLESVQAGAFAMSSGQLFQLFKLEVCQIKTKFELCAYLLGCAAYGADPLH